MRFRATVELHGKTATGIEVPAEVVESLGGGKRPAVAVTIGKYTYRTTIAPMGGQFLIPLIAEHRDAAGVAAGDQIDVTVELDTAPRIVEVPDDLAAALDAAGVREKFDKQSFTNRKEMARSVTEAKKPETRAARIAKAVAAVQPK